jgi:polyisoprenoid-binding protein YceI
MLAESDTGEAIRDMRSPIFFSFVVVLPALACSPSGPRTAYADSAHTRTVVTALPGSTTSVEALRLVLAPTGNAARYRVREQLVGHDLQNDAIGETTSVTGGISFDASGKVIPEASKFVLDAGSFVSDKDRRDGFVRRRLLEADQYPNIVLVPTDVRGVSLPLPTSGSRPIEIAGNLTIRGVTRPTSWKGRVQFQDGRIAGTAATAFTFNDIQIEQPRVPVLLSVADTIKLEIDFNLIRQP